MSGEKVNHPDHYGGDNDYECIKVLENWLTEDEYKGFLKGTIIKYINRGGKKDDIIQDISKAKWYIEEWLRFLGTDKCERKKCSECGETSEYCHCY